MSYKEKYKLWTTSDFFDEETKKELLAIADDEKEIESRFFADLEFGTGGLRGIIGAGTNRINKYTIRKATQGLARSILKYGKEFAEKGVVIAYDSRRLSKEFAIEAALTLNANGIKAYVFDDIRPTPLLSYTVRHLKAAAGIVITASHNPKEYNGYKVYWEDGGQLPPKHSDRVLADIATVIDIAGIEIADYDESIKNGMLTIIGKEIDDAYIESLKTLTINTEEVKDVADSLKIIYTPLHGTGNKLVRRILKETGFNNVKVVPEQEKPDSDFPTVESPNPEEKSAFKLAIEMAKKHGADLILGTDPDADRVGVVVKDDKGEYIVLEGNQTGVILTEYVLSQKKAKGLMPENPYCISTIVSTNLTEVISKNYGVEYIEVYTGFKFFGEKMHELDDKGLKNFITGFEESYGYLVGNYVRDKDAVVTCMMIAEMAAYYKKQGKTLYDAVQEVYEKYGYFSEKTIAFTLKGLDGLRKIQNTMKTIRENKPSSFGDIKVKALRDFQELKRYDFENNSVGDVSGFTYKSNVLYYEVNDRDWFCFRPSGTEPKLKVYFGVSRNTQKEAEAARDKLINNVMDYLKPMLEE